MSKFSNCILSADFDRTVTNHAGGIPQANLDAIRYFMDQGGVFVLNTGRSLPMSRYPLKDVPTNAPLLACNGAVCYDLRTETLLFCHPLPEGCEAFMQSYEQAYPQLRFEVHCLDKHYVFHEAPERDRYMQRQHTPYTQADWSMVPDPKVKFCLYSRQEDPLAVQAGTEEGRFFASLEADINRRGGGRYTAIHSLPGMVEVQAAGTSKGKAARELAQRLDRPVLVCVGDAPNDLPMLEEADIACIPADCAPQMRGRGFREVASCEEGAVAGVIHWLDERCERF